MDSLAISKILDQRKEPKFRGKQVAAAIYGQLVSTWDEATSLSKELREALAGAAISTVEPVKIAASQDGAEKVLFRLADGKQIESVLIPNGDFRTVCVSSQVGCAMRCAFCATGKLGLARNLSVDEIVDQVVHFERKLRAKKERVTNVVFMGMGEPFQNTENVFNAIRIMNSPDGLGIGARKISISTCGIVPGIFRLADFELQVNLAISLHAPTDDLRARLMPAENAYSIGQVLEACRHYVRSTGRKLMVEYVMLKGVNDGIDEARELAIELRDMKPLVGVNLIPMNDAGSEFQSSDRKTIETFRETLMREGMPCTIRRSLGPEIEGACGQLVGSTG